MKYSMGRHKGNNLGKKKPNVKSCAIKKLAEIAK